MRNPNPEQEQQWEAEKRKGLALMAINSPSLGNYVIAAWAQYWKERNEKDAGKVAQADRMIADIAKMIAAMPAESARKLLTDWEALAPHKRREGTDPNYGNLIRQKARMAWADLQYQAACSEKLTNGA